jgi:hypothetical protein
MPSGMWRPPVADPASPPSPTRGPSPPRAAILANLLLAAAAVSFAAAALEGVARLYAVRRAREPQTVGTLLLYDPERGWTQPPGQSAWRREAEFETLLETNAHGLRGPLRDYGRRAGVRRVLLLGDSFVEGYTVEEPRTVRAQVEKELGGASCGRIEVIGLGVESYGTDQEYLAYLAQGRRYEPSVVVLLFYGNDLDDNMRERKKPYFEVVDGRLALRNVPVPPPPPEKRLLFPRSVERWAHPWRGSWALELVSRRTASGNPRLHRVLSSLGLVRPYAPSRRMEDILMFYGPPNERTEEGWRRTEAILAALRDAVEKDGSRFAVFYVPSRLELVPRDWLLTRERWELEGEGWQASRIFDRLRHACGRLAIRLIDPRAPLTQAELSGPPAYLPTDPHWTAAGHAVAARVIARALADRELPDCRPEGR